VTPEQTAAVERLDAEVIAPTDRDAAIKELDAAVRAAERDHFPRLAAAIAEAQRVHAWEADESFAAALAAGDVTADGDGETRFTAWVEHRYGKRPTWAKRFGQSGRVLALTSKGVPSGTPQPANENQVRKLTPLLRLPDAAEVIPQVWANAVEAAEAEHKPESVGRHVAAIVRKLADEDRRLKPSARERADKLAADLRTFRKLFDHLRQVMPRQNFETQVLGWIAEHEAG
jgi:hypothetical protein